MIGWHQLYDENLVLRAENAALREAIQRVLDDEESRPGAWGPDVTCIRILRDALSQGHLQGVSK